MFFKFYSFSPKTIFIRLEKFFFVFFQVERVFIGTPKSEATPLWGVPFSSSLRALNLIKDL